MNQNLPNHFFVNEIARYWLKRDAYRLLKHPSMHAIIAVTTAYYDVDPKLLLTYSEQKNVKRARQIGIFFSKTLSHKTCRAIGMTFNRSHSSIIYSLQKTEKLFKVDESLCAEIAEIEPILRRSQIT